MSTDSRRIVDDYLTRIARKAWPSALVTVPQDSGDTKDYQLEVPGEKPFVLGTVFGPARTMLRAIVFEHLPPEANRAEFTLDVRVVSDERKPGPQDMERALRVGKALRDESKNRADAVLAGKLLAISGAGGAITLADIHSLRKLAASKGQAGTDYEQLAVALAHWCDLGLPSI
jgi:hypothetical protein